MYFIFKSPYIFGRCIRYYYLLLALIAISFISCGSGIKIDNPYESVDWKNHKQYKANFHTHTTRSDGRLNPDSVVDIYHALGYHILAITDHNEVTYPWTRFSEMDASKTSHDRVQNDPETMPANFKYEDKDPVVLKMIDIEGNEFSRHHHMGSFFNDLMGTSDVTESLEAIAAENGIVMLNHPGRYNYPVKWYTDLYQNHDHLIGLEVYNQGDRYPQDRPKWDSLLTVTMPERPIWAYSNDDMHTLPHVGRNWNMLILPELTHESVREGMENGLSYFIYAPGGHDGPEPPVITSIKADDSIIEIKANGYIYMEWISDGKVVHKGATIDISELENLGSYVRAMFYGPGKTVAGTQPFGIRKN